MRTIIAGSRTCTDYGKIIEAIRDCGWKPTVVISGAAKGADRLGELWARNHGVKLERFPADWDKNKKSAGHIRNVKMSEVAEALIALWNGQSSGTKDMIEIAQKKGLKVYVLMV